MLRVGRYVFKRAEGEREIEAVHRLNYQTFVREIRQHEDAGTGRLVDKLHDQNVYFVALREGRVVGMVSAHGDPPYSVADRLSDPALLERHGCRPLEVRLLAVEPDERNGFTLTGLLWMLYGYARERGSTDLFISAVAEQVKLYRHLGFAALGPPVPCGAASFVPMRMGLSQIQARHEQTIRRWRRHLERAGEGTPSPVSPVSPASPPLSLLPGPVAMASAVRAAFAEPPLYHREPAFLDRYEELRRRLGELVGGREVALWNGSGTLANEAVAATLAAELPATSGNGRGTFGVVLANGEFGQRLARQAIRCGLHPRVLTWEWGRPWELAEIDAALAEEPAGSWVWGVHLETSTGVLNDLPGLVRLAGRHGLRVSMDCISSLGAVPIDLRGVDLATGVTGKALGSYAGMSMVFADPAALRPTDPARLPTTFDLAAALATRGPRHTFPAPVALAAEAALADYATEDLARARYAHYAALGAYVRGELRELGIAPLAAEEHAGPVIATFAPPCGEETEGFVARCRSWGFAIGGQSGYLAERRLVQIATMGALTREDVAPFFARLGGWLEEGRGARANGGRFRSRVIDGPSLAE
jgi:aspartate aminotransferase-like enzyme